MSRCLVFCLHLRYSRRLRQNTRRYGYRGLKIFTSLTLRFHDFQRLKNVLGAFHFHFWSQYLPRHSRRSTTNRNLKPPRPEHLTQVLACWRAMETFVFCACVAAGLLQLFSLKYSEGLWQRQVLYLRTRSRELPSEKYRPPDSCPPCWLENLTGLAKKTACGDKFAKLSTAMRTRITDDSCSTIKIVYGSAFFDAKF